VVINIFITSWYRKEMTEKTVNLIHERTDSGTFAIHIFDNGSDKKTRDFLYGLLEQQKIVSLHLDSRNTGCLYNKGIFHMMTEASQDFYMVTDNDIYPPKLTPDWLSQMVKIMEAHPNLAFLTPQCPPQRLSEPDMDRVMDDIVYCKAVGNILKMVRRKAFPLQSFRPTIGAYGDDGLVCDLVRSFNYESAFCRNIFAYHAGQCENWGYKKEEIDNDPRKAGYGKPFTYKIINKETYEPESENRI